jgi:SPP1 gp7 family putative phage head morphogenesis protein
MTLSRLQQVIAEYRKRLLAQERTAMASLDYAHRQTLSIIDSSLDLLYRSMTLYMQGGQPIPLEWLYENQRLQVLEQYIRAQIDHFGALTQTQVTQLQYFGAQLGQQAGMALLNSTVPPGVNFSFGMPSPDAIAHLVGATQKGSPLADLFSGFGAEAAQGAKNALISGVTLGYNPRQIAPSIQDALNISRNRALTIARTEMLRSYRDSNVATFQANSDVVDQWRWTCDLSSRTCAACLSMDGELFPIDETLDSHVNCRCTPVPVTKSWEDILGPLGIDTSMIPETSGAEDMQTGEEWFSNQDESVQRDILGNKGYDLYANGDVTLQDFVGHTSDPDWGDSIYQKPIKELVK